MFHCNILQGVKDTIKIFRNDQARVLANNFKIQITKKKLLIIINRSSFLILSIGNFFAVVQNNNSTN